MNYHMFMNFVSEQNRNQKLLARIALNVLGHSDKYPVNVIELRSLTPLQRAAVNGLLDWTFVKAEKPILGYHMNILGGMAIGGAGAQDGNC